jgi:hypothetical protein
MFYNVCYDGKEYNEVDDNLNWKKHVEYIIPKLNSACFVIPLLKIPFACVLAALF